MIALYIKRGSLPKGTKPIIIDFSVTAEYLVCNVDSETKNKKKLRCTRAIIISCFIS